MAQIETSSTTQATGGVAGALLQVADGLGHLVVDHLALARIEVAQDVGAIAGQLGRLAAFIPLLIVGDAFLCGAVALGVAPWLGLPWALLILGLLNLGAGALGTWAAVRRLQALHPLEESARQAARSAAMVAPAGNGKVG